MDNNLQRLKVLSAGVLSLILTLGIARFAYTPLIPLMEQQAGMSTAQSGWLAAFNYLGYICGAFFASSLNDLILKDKIYRFGLIIAILTTVGMGLTENWIIWSLLRFFAGLSSAAGLLIGSGLILNWLLRHNHRSELGIHFSGIGLGIVVCAVAVEWMIGYFSWDQQWIILSLLGVFIALPAWRWLPRPARSILDEQNAQLPDNPPTQAFFLMMVLVYFCAGVGYVISATFIVAIVDQLPQTQGQGNIAFLVVGIAATPACILWDLIARRTGVLNALILAFILHTIGILIPTQDSGLTYSLLGAALYGASFIGIVSLVLTMAGRFYPSKPAKMMGKMTLSYGVAQIFAPALTGLLAEQSGNYNGGLYMAAGFMAAGTLLLLVARSIVQHQAELQSQEAPQ